MPWVRVDRGGDLPCSQEKDGNHQWAGNGDPGYQWCFFCGVGKPGNREFIEYDPELNALRISREEAR